MIKFIDTSHWDGNLDFQKLFDLGIYAFYPKATEGTGGVDSEFLNSVSKIKAIPGAIWGAYHYFRVYYDPIIQAEHFYEYAKYTQLPPVIDVEPYNNTGLTKAVFTANLEKCVNRLIQLFTRKICIYTGYYAWQDLTTSPAWAANCYLWDANYQVLVPRIPLPWTNYLYWQFTDRDPIGNDTFDANYFNGTKEDLYKLANLEIPNTLEERVKKLEDDVILIKEKIGLQ